MMDIKRVYRFFIFLAFLSAGLRGTAGDIYVGKTAHFSTLEEALREAREWRRLGDARARGGITIWVEDGFYTPAQTILIRPEDSGTKDSPTYIRAVGSKAVFSGAVQLHAWKRVDKLAGVSNKVAKQLFVADAPQVGGKYISFRQLWVNGQKATRAESHDDQHLPRILNWDFEKGTATIPNIFPAFKLSAGMEFFIHQWWAVAQLRIRDAQVARDSIVLSFYEPEARIQSEHPWPKPWLSQETGNSAFRLVNALQFLDQPGEWFLDEQNHKVYYYPLEGEHMDDATAFAPHLETILQMKGTLEDPVKEVHIEGLHFQHTGWLRPNTHGHVALQAGMYFIEAYKLEEPGTPDKAGLENQAWVGRPRAGVELKNTMHTSIRGCTFTLMASTGIDFRSGNYQDTLIGNLFQNIGGSGVLLGTFSDEQVEAHLPYEPTDLRELTNGTLVTNNLVQRVGLEDWGAVGIGAGFVRNVQITHNELIDLPYTGVSLGWGWTPTINTMKNNKVVKNKITRYGKFMYDVAGIYTLSAQPGTKIQRNIIDSIYFSPYAHLPDHWFYLYTDEGSAYMNVSENWFPANKILRNANGPGVEWYNNGPQVDAKQVANAGLERDFKFLRKYLLPLEVDAQLNIYVPSTKPAFVQLYDPEKRINRAAFNDFMQAEGGDTTQVYRWNDYTLVKTTDEHARELWAAARRRYPEVERSLFTDPFYSFDRSRCGEKEEVGDSDFVLLTAQLSEDETMQDAYMDAHKTQYEKWPEVANGFCQAGFNEVLLYRSGRQLMLYIAFPKGEEFEKINPLTTKDNPRVDDWNKMMGGFQEGIDGTTANETWIFYKK